MTACENCDGLGYHPTGGKPVLPCLTCDGWGVTPETEVPLEVYEACHKRDPEPYEEGQASRPPIETVEGWAYILDQARRGG